jgi:hypothetical protein
MSKEKLKPSFWHIRSIKNHQNRLKMRKLWFVENKAIKKLKIKISKHLKSDNLE